MIEIDAMNFDCIHQPNDYYRNPCQANRLISMFERNLFAMNVQMMRPIEAVLSESKMAVVILVLDIHNGISVYHMSDRGTYLTAIGFFANVNKL